MAKFSLHIEAESDEELRELLRKISGGLTTPAKPVTEPDLTTRDTLAAAKKTLATKRVVEDDEDDEDDEPAAKHTKKSRAAKPPVDEDDDIEDDEDDEPAAKPTKKTSTKKKAKVVEDDDEDEDEEVDDDEDDSASEKLRVDLRKSLRTLAAKTDRKSAIKVLTKFGKSVDAVPAAKIPAALKAIKSAINAENDD